MPRRSEILVGIACLAALLIAFDLLTLAFGRDVVPRFMREAYVSARSSNSLVLFFLAVVVVAPIAEEVAFRGFLFRGLSATWLGVAGAMVLTSAAWAAMHVQYDWVTLAQIFLIGLLLGWLRWASGSTLLTILLQCWPTSQPPFRRRSRWSGGARRVIPGRAQRDRAWRGPMTGYGASPESITTERGLSPE